MFPCHAGKSFPECLPKHIYSRTSFQVMEYLDIIQDLPTFLEAMGIQDPLDVGISDGCQSFLEAMLKLDPTQRASAQELLDHEYLQGD